MCFWGSTGWIMGDSHLQGTGRGGPGAAMSSRLALAGLTHTHGGLLCGKDGCDGCLPGGPGQGGQGTRGPASAVRCWGQEERVYKARGAARRRDGCVDELWGWPGSGGRRRARLGGPLHALVAW